MILNFDAMDETVLKNFKGGEKNTVARMYADPRCRIMRSRLESGASIGMHTHETSCEIIYCLSGSGKVIIDGIQERLTAGCCHYCPKGHTHTLINDGAQDLTFVAVVPEQ